MVSLGDDPNGIEFDQGDEIRDENGNVLFVFDATGTPIAVDGDSQPPEHHGNGAHTDNYALASAIFSGEYSDLTSVPNTFTAETHGNGSHTKAYAAQADVGSANGIASLDANSQVPNSQLPALAITDTYVLEPGQALTDLTQAETGDVAIDQSASQSYILRGNEPTVESNWEELESPEAAVSSVFGRTSDVTAESGDYTVSQITNAASEDYVDTEVSGKADNPHGDGAHSVDYALASELFSGSYDNLVNVPSTFTPEDHSLSGDRHTTDTLANLNSKISDATLDDAEESRPPDSHDHAGDALGESAALASVTTETLSDTVEFAVGDSDTAGINEAINRLPAGGGTVVVPGGTYTLSDQPLVPDNVTLVIPAGCTLSPASDFSPSVMTALNGYDTVGLITNPDHENGNENVNIVGAGRIHDENDNLDPLTSLAGVWLHKCTRSQIGNGETGMLEIDNIAYNITSGGGPSGEDQRFFSAYITEGQNSTINGVYGHHTGDDTLGIRRSSKACSIKNCESHNAKYGHCAQSASSSTHMGRPNGVCENIEIKDNYFHDTDGGDWSEAGASLHHAQGVVKNNVIENTGSGVLLLGDSSGSTTQNNVIKQPRTDRGAVTILGHSSGGGPLENICVDEPDIELRASTTQSGVYVYPEAVSIRDVDIDVAVTGDLAEAPSHRGVYLYSDGNTILESVNVDVTATGMDEDALTIIPDDAGATIRDVTARITARVCGRGARILVVGGSLSDIVIDGGTIRENGETTRGHGIIFSGVSDCICSNVDATVSSDAFVESSGSDYNTFIGNNGRGSGTSTVQTVGANTETVANQP
ncbi:right-handed parallel beta-helix repeat-containing protein [Saliphagus sp. LR7]|uniref:right-handed parallel beta-helix repeat-containing protein n=1 Tax=Saliphagus sp. LR7 TaxID=2282654 RepID=UPI000DF72BA7|nr:right-handed parallel beta-helix repeat-containing protein [Saliphagus sp. LR7]